MTHRKSAVSARLLLGVVTLAFGAACSGTVAGTEATRIQITNESGAPIRYEAYTPEVAATVYRGSRISLAEIGRTPEHRASWNRAVVQPGSTITLDATSVAGDFSYDDTVVFYFYEIGESEAVMKEIRAFTPSDLKALGHHIILRASSPDSPE